MSRQYQQGHKEFFNRLYDCPQVFQRRLRHEEFNLDRPYMPVIAATTPSRFYKYTDDDWVSGFLARWLIVTP